MSLICSQILDPRNTQEKNLWTHKILTRRNFGHKKTHEKNFGPTKYPREQILDPQNTHDKKFNTYEIPAGKNFGPEVPTWINLEPTKYQHENNLDPRRHDGTNYEINGI